MPWEPRSLGEPPASAQNPTSSSKVELGRLLFYDPILSSDGTVACATCHSESWGLSDGLGVSIGIAGVGPAGPGRTGPNATRRNAQTLWNVAYRGALFWDGRGSSLEDQVLEPLASAIELGRDSSAVLGDLAANDAYQNLFAAAFPGEESAITVDNLARAIAAFERTLVSSRAPYDLYVAGDGGALSEESVRGMFLFAEAGCARCHVPPLFESDTFADRGVTNRAGIDDGGRYEVTGQLFDAGLFRAPTLRNLRETAPYFHNGSEASMEAAVAREALRSYVVGESRQLSPEEIAAIATFLNKALIDRSQGPSRPKQVPSGLPVPVDGFRIPR